MTFWIQAHPRTKGGISAQNGPNPVTQAWAANGTFLETPGKLPQSWDTSHWTPRPGTGWGCGGSSAGTRHLTDPSRVYGFGLIIADTYMAVLNMDTYM